MPFGLFTAKSTGLGRWLRSTRTIFPLHTTFWPGVTFCPMEAGRLSTSTLPASMRRSASRLEQTPIWLSHLFKRSSIFSRFLLIFPQSLPLLSSRMGCNKHSVPYTYGCAKKINSLFYRTCQSFCLLFFYCLQL